jgi:Prenyltransferase and squalene oxidase repeat
VSRKPAVLALVALVSVLVLTPEVAVPADTSRRPRAASWEVTQESREAVKLALEYLVRTQKSNGGWSCAIGFKRDTDYAVTVPSGKADHVGVTALAGTAFLAGGHLPGRGKWCRSVSRALDNVLSHVGEDGYISSGGTFGTRMYSHAFATLFLAEVYGMTPRTDVRPRLQRAVDFTVRCQNSQGGWRYLPFDMYSDMSVTVCQIMALRAARNKGIRVPQENIDRAIAYVLRSAIIRSRGRDNGAFNYIIHDPRQARTSFSLTAAGLTTLYGCGIYNDGDLRKYVRRLGDGTLPVPNLDASVKHLLREYDNRGKLPRSHYFFFYGNYYAAQAMFFRGKSDWRKYFPKVRKELVSLQILEGTNRGAWRSNVGPAFTAAVGAIILQVPYRYLPILQR